MKRREKSDAQSNSHTVMLLFSNLTKVITLEVAKAQMVRPTYVMYRRNVCKKYRWRFSVADWIGRIS